MNENKTPTPAGDTQPIPAKHKTIAGKIIAEAVTIVEAPVKFAVKEFGIIAKNFANEQPAIQADLQAVSGMLQLIKLNLNEDAKVIVWVVKKAYPQFDEATILSYLTTGITDMGLATTIIAPDLSTTIQNIAQHLLGVTDTGWKLFWDGLFKAVSMVAVKGGTWEKLIQYASYVYQVLVKPVVK